MEAAAWRCQHHLDPSSNMSSSFRTNACATRTNSTIPTCLGTPRDCDVEKSIGRHRAQCGAGGPAGCHSNGGLLSRLARSRCETWQGSQNPKSINSLSAIQPRPRSASTAMRLIRSVDVGSSAPTVLSG